MVGALPVVDRPPGRPTLLEYLEGDRETTSDLLREHGAVAYRGFDGGASDLAAVVSLVAGSPAVPYLDRTSPRRDRGPLRYSSTEYPSHQHIALHSESSYQHTVPTHVALACEVPPSEGGATTLCDGRAALAAMPRRLIERFEAGVVYRRTFHPELGLAWTEAFQTERRRDVEAYAASAGIGLSWRGDRLTTWQRRPVIGADGMGRAAWANHVELFHPAGLDPRLRRALHSVYGDDQLPLDVRYADDSRIPAPDFAALSTTTGDVTIQFDWERGDVLIVDNLRMMHGREPYSGRRELVVSMAGARDWSARQVTR